MFVRFINKSIPQPLGLLSCESAQKLWQIRNSAFKKLFSHNRFGHKQQKTYPHLRYTFPHQCNSNFQPDILNCVTCIMFYLSEDELSFKVNVCVCLCNYLLKYINIYICVPFPCVCNTVGMGWTIGNILSDISLTSSAGKSPESISALLRIIFKIYSNIVLQLFL